MVATKANLLETVEGEIPPCEIPEAADGRFFNGPEMYRISDKFWLEHEDLLPEGYGTIIQVGVMSDGSWSSPHNHKRESTWTLHLDCRERNVGIYNWQLTMATPQKDNITVIKVQTTQFGSRAEQYILNMAREPKSIEVVEAELICERVNAILQLPELTERVAALRKVRANLEAHLSRFVVEKMLVYHTEKYLKAIEKEQKKVDDVGFEEALPYCLTNQQLERFRAREKDMKKWLADCLKQV